MAINDIFGIEIPKERPKWLFIGCYPTCFSYADRRKKENGEYKLILRLFYNPLRIEINEANKKAYPEVLEIAKQELKQLQSRVNQPLEVSASGQTTDLSISSGPDVVIVNY